MAKDDDTGEDVVKVSGRNFLKGFNIDKVRKNPWILSTAVLGLVLIIAFFSYSGGITASAVGSGSAGQNVIDYVDSIGKGPAELVSVEKEDSFYLVTVSLEGTEIPVYVTLDGKYLVGSLVPLTEVEQESSVITGGESEVAEDWTVFENELPADVKQKMLSKKYSEPTVVEGRILEFKDAVSVPNTLVVFYHDGCGWCQKYYPVLVEAQEKYPEITIYALYLSSNQDVADRFGVTGTPGNVLNGKYLISGYMPIEDLTEILDKY